MPFNLDASTTVLHAVACDDDLVDVASLVVALSRRPSFRQVIVHAGARSNADDVGGLVGIDHRLDIEDGTHAERTAASLIAFESLMDSERPEIVVVAGDDDLVVAAAMAAAKQGVAVAHLGSGLRCHDWTQADEVNRTMIDRLSDTLFTLSDDASLNLRDEGVPAGRIHCVGNTRVDVLRRSEARARTLAAWEAHGAVQHRYTLVALRRPATFEGVGAVERLTTALTEVAAHGPVLVLAHEGIKPLLESAPARALLAADGVRVVKPGGYLESLSLQLGAGAIVTDAGPVQEDASALGVRCFTLQARTPHTTTLTHGTNVLLGSDPSAVSSVRPTGCAPTPAAVPLWDGRAGERVADALAANYTLAAASGRDL